MKKSLRIATVLVVLSVAFGCVIVGLAQNRPIVGGYKVVATDDPEVVAAAEFAVSEKKGQQDGPLSLVSIEHAERQVVAGMNYRLCIKVKAADETDAGEETQDVKVVVFRSLQKEYSLKSWDEENCSETGSDGESAR
jgi:hypothetical protein